MLGLKSAVIFCERLLPLMLVAGLGGLVGPKVGALIEHSKSA